MPKIFLRPQQRSFWDLKDLSETPNNILRPKDLRETLKIFLRPQRSSWDPKDLLETPTIFERPQRSSWDPKDLLETPQIFLRPQRWRSLGFQEELWGLIEKIYTITRIFTTVRSVWAELVKIFARSRDLCVPEIFKYQKKSAPAPPKLPFDKAERSFKREVHFLQKNVRLSESVRLTERSIDRTTTVKCIN